MMISNLFSINIQAKFYFELGVTIIEWTFTFKTAGAIYISLKFFCGYNSILEFSITCNVGFNVG